MIGPLTIALAGHASVGKTSLVSALTRDATLVLGEAAGTTRAHYVKVFALDGEPILRFVDTPGFEFASRINDALDARGGQGAERRDGRALLAEFAGGEGVHARHDRERDALAGVLAADVIAYVADVVLPPEGQLVQEVRLLRRAGVPMIGVLNNLFVQEGAELRWIEMLRREGVDAIVRLDAIRLPAEQEHAFYDALRVLRPEQSPAFLRVAALRARRDAETRAASVRAIAEALVDALAFRDVSEHPGPVAAEAARSAANERFKERLRARERVLFDELARVHGFPAGGVTGAALAVPSWSGAVQEDLFDPEALRRYGLTAGTLAAVGALAGAVIDPFGGHGLGAVLGGVAGAAAGLFVGRRVSAEVDAGRLTVGPVDGVQFPSVLLHRALDCRALLAERSHADRGEAVLGSAPPVRLDARAARVLFAEARRCRRNPSWSRLVVDPPAPERARTVTALADLLRSLLPPPERA